MDSDITKERIGILKNEMNQLWSAILATGGGSVILFLNADSIFHMVISVVGFFIMAIFINAFIIKRTAIIKLLERMEKNEY